MALRMRASKGMASSAFMALRWAAIVTMHETSGQDQERDFLQEEPPVGLDQCNDPLAPPYLRRSGVFPDVQNESGPSGQKSRSSRTNGSVTTMGFDRSPSHKQHDHEKIVPRALPPSVSFIGKKGEQEKERAQQIFPLRDPGNRLHVQWMQGEEGGDKCAFPQGSRHALQYDEQDQGVQDVKKEVDLVMSSRVEPEPLNIEHVGEPGQRMPVAVFERAEGPPDSLQAQAVADDRILYDVLVVIISNEFETAYLPVDRRGDDDEGQSDQDGLIPCSFMLVIAFTFFLLFSLVPWTLSPDPFPYRMSCIQTASRSCPFFFATLLEPAAFR